MVQQFSESDTGEKNTSLGGCTYKPDDINKYNVPNITINTNIPGMLCTLYQQETQTSIYYQTYQHSRLFITYQMIQLNTMFPILP